ncbi:MAG TPA: DUF3341 domain-containing protein [Bacteroidetes bacterium]|nr:DUF3341 domain-containing protein [Bacteroidota bacterium]
MKSNSIIGIYKDENVLLEAIDELLANNIRIYDVFSPFPLHGIFEKLKLKTRIPYATFIYGVIGTISVFAFLYWTSVVNYPLKFGGKPLNTLSFIIIMFVLTIFVATLFTFLTYFTVEKMWPGKEAKLPVPRTTSDEFAILIEKKPDMDKNELDKITRLLEKTGATEIKESEVDY